MKIKKTIKYFLRKEEYFYDVFGIYWSIDPRDNKAPITYFYGISPNYEAMEVFALHEVSIVDPNIYFRPVFFSGTMPGIFHWALIEKELLDEVIEHDSKCYREFLSIVRKEGLIDW